MRKQLPDNYRVNITHIDEDRGAIFSEYHDDDPYPTAPGELYRTLQAAYGRCMSRVYVDREGKPPAHVGWYFVSRERYEDTREPYLRGTWATVSEIPGPVPPPSFIDLEAARP